MIGSVIRRRFWQGVRAMPTGDAKVIVVMPARNAARTLERTVEAIPRDLVDEIILVDDKSTDDTIALARRIPELRVIWHPHNVGYGGNQKTCYLEALQRDADVVVMLHPDGQYEPTLIPDMVRPILAGEADLVLGSRFLIPGGPSAGGMPRYKQVAMHTGYRAYSRAFLMGIPFLRNALDFSFDSEVLMQAAHFGYRIAEVPARTNYDDDASSIGLWASTVYGVKTLGAAARLVAHRAYVIRSRIFLP